MNDKKKMELLLSYNIAYWSHAQVVCVSKTDLTPKTLQLIHGDSLQSPLGTDRHENRGANGAMWQY